MTILDELMASLNYDAPIRSVLVGAHWTAVCSRYCGLASTVMAERPHPPTRVRDVGSLHQKSARELVEYAHSNDLLEASIGVATINSLLERQDEKATEINAFDVLARKGKNRNVALVGHFPFIPKLRTLVGQLWVLEQQPAEDEYPADAAEDLIPKADVVALTGTSLINHTMEGLLALCHPGMSGPAGMNNGGKMTAQLWTGILVHGTLVSLVASIILMVGLKINPRTFLQDYPRAIQKKVPPKTAHEKKLSYLIGIPFMLVLVLGPFLSTLALKNAGETSFLELSLNAAGILIFFNVVDWLILDWLIFCTLTPRFLVIPGSEGMAEYKDYGFHFRGFLLGIIFSCLGGLIIAGGIFLI